MKKLFAICVAVLCVACSDEKKETVKVSDLKPEITMTQADAQVIYDNMSKIMTLSDNPKILAPAVATRKISKTYLYTEQK